MVGVTLALHPPVDVHHLLAVAEAEAAVSAGVAATADLDRHPREIGLLSVLIGRGVPGEAGVPDVKRALRCRRGAGSALHPLMRENQGAGAAPLQGMIGGLMVLIMVGALGQGAEAPWMNLKERAPGTEMLVALMKQMGGIVALARMLGMTGMEGRMMMTTTKLLPGAVNNLTKMLLAVCSHHGANCGKMLHSL